MHPFTLTLSTGRCGTTFLASTFLQCSPSTLRVYHEALHPSVARPAQHHFVSDRKQLTDMLAVPEVAAQLARWKEEAQGRPVVEFGWTAYALAPLLKDLFGESLRLLYIHRHPFSVAGSFCNLGHYRVNSSPAWAITPSHPRVRHSLPQERWAAMSFFERGLYRWLEINCYAGELIASFPPERTMVLASQDLFRDPTASITSIGAFMGLAQRDAPAPAAYRNAVGPQYIESFPITKRDIDRGLQFPELVQFAEELGYDMSRANCLREARKYMLPPSSLSYLRYFLRYWRIRFHLSGLAAKLAKR